MPEKWLLKEDKPEVEGYGQESCVKEHWEGAKGEGFSEGYEKHRKIDGIPAVSVNTGDRKPICLPEQARCSSYSGEVYHRPQKQESSRESEDTSRYHTGKGTQLKACYKVRDSEEEDESPEQAVYER